MTSDDGIAALIDRLRALREAGDWRPLALEARFVVDLIDALKTAGPPPGLEHVLIEVTDCGAWGARKLRQADDLHYFARRMLHAAHLTGRLTVQAHALGWRALAHEMKGDLVAAAACYRDALDILAGIDHPAHIEQTIRVNYAELLTARGESAAAREVLGPVGSLPPETPDLSPAMARAHRLGVRVNRAVATGDPAESAAAYQDALDAGDRYAAGAAAGNIGVVLLDQGRPGEAIPHLSTAVEILGPIGRDESYGAVCLNLAFARHTAGEPDALGPAKEAWDVLRACDPSSPRALRALHLLASLRLAADDLDRARAGLDYGLDLYESIRPQLAVLEAEHSATLGVYRLMLESRIIIAMRDGWPDQAVEFIERGKARFWSEQIAVRDPGRAVVRENPHPDELITTLGPYAVMVNCFVGPHATFVAYGRLGRQTIRHIPLPEDVVRSIVRSAVGSLPPWETRAEGVDLHRMLLGAVLLNDVDFSRVQTVFVFPDGPLWNVPFEVLPVPARDASDLGDLAAVVTAPTMRVLQQLRPIGAGSQDAGGWRVVAVGGVRDDIPDTLRQVERLRRINDSVVSLTGRAATRGNLLEHAAGATHLHIAAHASAGGGEASYIELSDGDGGVDRLFEPEIARLELSAELVFLSACSTGAGDESEGEGLASVARAFILAGARCVVAAPWPIPDRHAAALVDDFYTALEAGMAVARAARAARVKAKEAGRNVRVWASLPVLGYGLDGDDQLRMLLDNGG